VRRRHSVLPTFLIIGAMRSGTTSLARSIGAHPDVFMAREKEIHFFDADLHVRRRGSKSDGFDVARYATHRDLAQSR
jgi:hypothetical protein